jgi:hypothetical protein
VATDSSVFGGRKHDSESKKNLKIFMIYQHSKFIREGPTQPNIKKKLRGFQERAGVAQSV